MSYSSDPSTAPTDSPHERLRTFPNLLIVCKANQCRSPLGEALARRSMIRRRLNGSVQSAGLEAIPDSEATEGTAMAARKAGLDVSSHRSRLVTTALVAASDLVLAMERDQVIKLVTEYGSDLHRTFTVPELAHLVRSHPPEQTSSWSAWLADATANRQPMAVLAMTGYQVADPSGRALRHYKSTIKLLEADIDTILDAMTLP